MPRRRTGEIRRITAEEFAKRLKVIAENEPEKRFAFLLGAGCSVSSGIPAAGRLVRDEKAKSDWLRRLRDVREPSVSDAGLDEWARKELSHWDPDDPGASYGELIERLFLYPGDRQEEIHRLCAGEHIKRQLGYVVLSGLLTQYDSQFNIVLTTNFDDLLSDALSYFRQTRPLVIAHDSLAPFIRSTAKHPLIIKLHGDHQLAPRNTATETDALDHRIAERVATVLHDRGLIVLGYGGNDESIIAMLEQLPEEALPYGVFWVSGSEPRGVFRAWLEDRNAVWVEHRDFDTLMMLLEDELSVDPPDKALFEKVFQNIAESRQSLANRVADEDKAAVGEPRTPDWWLFDLAAQGVKVTDPEGADAIYRRGIETLPASYELLGNYANFLWYERKQPDQAEEFYERALVGDPKNATILGNYAYFFHERKQPIQAEEFYKRSLACNPKEATALGNYANFLWKERKQPDQAGEFYKRAIEADPEYAQALGNYAAFCWRVRKQPDQAEEFFKRAIEADPKLVSTLGNYANFLWNERKQPDQAKEFYKRAIDADPKDTIALVNYALFLRRERKRPDEAEELYKRAIDADPKDATALSNYAIFLGEERKQPDQAEKFYKRAIDADPKDANLLGGYANFLWRERNQPGQVEEFYIRAIDADPQNANNLGNYAMCLLAAGRRKEGLEKLNEATELHASEPARDLSVELGFYWYAQGPAKERSKWLARLKKLLKDGVRSPGWDLTPIVERATKDRHPAKSWLGKLAAVIGDEAKLDTLKKWKAWKDAK
ncbi:MAG: tetratricopeptide repeat protein [Planctomycetes bacterium]|nr:tetratricopeptide repeat protein [Planctomycetota bacterium]